MSDETPRSEPVGFVRPAPLATPLDAYELDAVRERDQNARHPAATWAVADRRRLLATLDAERARQEPAPLDAAWAAAEAALPWEHALGPSLYQNGGDGLWTAYAVERSLLRPMPITVKGYPTPVAALRALAAALAEPES